MERSSERGVRCQCGHLNQPTKSLWCVCARCGDTFPFRIEQRTFYVSGAAESNRCTCDLCEGRISVEQAAMFLEIDDRSE